jgi:hypothetical protein
MTITLTEEAIHLSGECGVEEAEALYAALAARPDRHVELGGASSLHAAILQVLLSTGARITGQPADAFLARWVMPALLAAGKAPP